LAQISHLDEVWSAITLLYLKPLVSNLDTDYIKETFTTDELQFCDFILGKVSRSFAAVIRQLPKQLLVDIMIFYLVLRALDTIEDDTTAFKSHADKILKLKEFHKFALVDSTWTLDGVGEGDERRLLQEFPKCQAIFSKLKEPSRKVISDITERMADGMAEFVDKDMGQGTVDVTQYNRYCHFVAGLVGEGLSRLFAASGLETASFAGELILSDQMGLFLQKVNIIRDYLEDYVDGRAWWPQTVWKKYSKTGDLGYFSDQDDPEAAKQALYCLNELVSDALELAPSCLAYMSKLQCIEVFRFCAIPQVMAIATLDKLYSNPKVFTGVVKIRKGMSCKLILQTNTLPELHAIFYEFANSILQKARRERNRGVVDPSFDRTVKACDAIVELTETTRLRKSSGNLIFRFLVLVVGFHVVKYTSPPEWFKSLHEPADNILRGIALIIGSIVFLQNTAKGKSNLKTADAILGGK
jgi:farnesyl-diphosphate farnesyltransferase